MHLFYTPTITYPEYTLSEDESKHCIRVLRLGINDKIILVDGKGGWNEAEIIIDHPKQCKVHIYNTYQQPPLPYYLHIGIAPTKNTDRLEWFIEKATEIGIHQISLLDCQHNERSIIKTERLEKVTVSAMKQSLKAYLPIINPLSDFKTFITFCSKFEGKKLIAHCYSPQQTSNKKHLKNYILPHQPVLILIGPEGDFSLAEVQLALKNGFEEISLGASRLRTETAALAACLTVQIMNE